MHKEELPNYSWSTNNTRHQIHMYSESNMTQGMNNDIILLYVYDCKRLRTFRTNKQTSKTILLQCNVIYPSHSSSGIQYGKEKVFCFVCLIKLSKDKRCTEARSDLLVYLIVQQHSSTINSSKPNNFHDIYCIRSVSI